MLVCHVFVILNVHNCLWGLTLYQGYIILTAWYPPQPGHLIIRRSKKYKFKSHLHHGDTWSGKEYDILLNFKIPNLHKYFFCLFFFSIVVLCMKTGQIYLFRNYKPNKRIQVQFGITPILRVWHIKQLRIDITSAFILKKVSKSLNWLMLLYNLFLDIEWVFRVLWHKISALV